MVYIEPEFIFNGKILGVLPTSPQQRAEENVNFPIAVQFGDTRKCNMTGKRDTGRRTERAEMQTYLSSQEG